MPSGTWYGSRAWPTNERPGRDLRAEERLRRERVTQQRERVLVAEEIRLRREAESLRLSSKIAADCGNYARAGEYRQDAARMDRRAAELGPVVEDIVSANPAVAAAREARERRQQREHEARMKALIQAGNDRIAGRAARTGSRRARVNRSTARSAAPAGLGGERLRAYTHAKAFIAEQRAAGRPVNYFEVRNEVARRLFGADGAPLETRTVPAVFA